MADIIGNDPAVALDVRQGAGELDIRHAAVRAMGLDAVNLVFIGWIKAVSAIHSVNELESNPETIEPVRNGVAAILAVWKGYNESRYHWFMICQSVL